MGWFSKGGKDEQPGAAPGQAGHPAPAPAAPDRRAESPAPSPASPAASAPAAPPAAPARPAESEPPRASAIGAVLGAAFAAGRATSEHAPAAVPQPARSLDGASVLADSVELEGSLEGDGDVILRGRVHGSIVVSGTLLIAESGRVEADVGAREVINAGTVEGNIRASERVRVQATGLVHGDIDAPSVVIDDGGGVEGFVQMGSAPGEEDEEAPEAAGTTAPQRPASAGLLRRAASMSATPPGVPAAAEPRSPAQSGAWVSPPAPPLAVSTQPPSPPPPAPATAPAPPAASAPAVAPPALTAPLLAPAPMPPGATPLPPPPQRPAAAGLLFRPPAAPAPSLQAPGSPAPGASSPPPSGPAAAHGAGPATPAPGQAPLVATAAMGSSQVRVVQASKPPASADVDPFGEIDEPAAAPPEDETPIL